MLLVLSVLVLSCCYLMLEPRYPPLCQILQLILHSAAFPTTLTVLDKPKFIEDLNDIVVKT
jgi:hypothetical protein